MLLTLRKLRVEDFEQIEAQFQSRAGASEHQWFGFWDSAKLVHRWHRDHCIGGEDGALALDLDGQLIGKVDWFTVTGWGRANTSACWEIAIGVFDEFRGQGHGTRAQRLLVDYLFEHYPRHRIQATTAAENQAEQRILTNLGFTLEGRIRQAQWRAGRWHDQLLYSILRAEWAPPA